MENEESEGRCWAWAWVSGEWRKRWVEARQARWVDEVEEERKIRGRVGEVKSVRREELATERNGKGREKEKRKENKVVK